jgi:hypothetical protein
MVPLLPSENLMFDKWFALTAESTRLAIESQQVIALRFLKIAAGGTAAQTEIVRMMTEKVDALAEGTATLVAGGSPGTVMRRYRTHVKANVRRLSSR